MDATRRSNLIQDPWRHKDSKQASAHTVELECIWTLNGFSIEAQMRTLHGIQPRFSSPNNMDANAIIAFAKASDKANN